MMKKTLLVTAIVAALSLTPAFAADTNWDPTLHQAQSCAEVETVLNDYLKSRYQAGMFYPMRGGGMMEDAVSAPSASNWVSKWDAWMGGGWWNDFSTTNVQKEWVDEPDIIKTNGTYIYYLDQSKGILRILDAKNQKEISSIVLPKDYWNAQLLINWNKLILVGSKSLPYIQARVDASFVARDQQALIAVYSIAQATPKLIQAYTFDGYLQDTRIVDNNLVLVSTQSLSRWPVYKMANVGSTPAIDTSKISLKAQDILPKWSTLTYATIKSANWKSRVVTRKKTLAIDCSQLLYKKPDPLQKNSQYYGWESLTTIVRLPLNTDAKPQIKTIMWNSSQIHVSNKSIYLTSPTYMRQPFVCPMNAMCMPWRGEGQYTTIYGFGLDGLKYNYATVVNWNTRNQYSMDENADWKFRIVTSNWTDWKNNSNVFIVGSDGKVSGKLENIAPGEQFYGVRFIGNYLYLVTYRQIDPLFVIDTTDATKPAIVGELKMPWYSTYLHPYGALKDGVQYLIGLGYETKISPEWREQQVWIKLDLYKVNFAKKDTKWNVDVSQVWTRTLWQAWSQTEALSNPRMFVFNQTTKELVLPIVLAETKKVQSCNIVYDMDGKEIRKDCYPYDQAVTTFAGVKAWTLWMDAAFETISVDYKSILKNPYPGDMVKPMEGDAVSNSVATFVDPRWFSALQSRVGYNGSQYYFIGNQFANFFTKADQKGVMVEFK